MQISRDYTIELIAINAGVAVIVRGNESPREERFAGEENRPPSTHWPPVY